MRGKYSGGDINFKNKLINLSDEKLMDLINNGNIHEKYLAKQELNTREILNHLNEDVDKKRKKLRIPFFYRIDFRSVIKTVVVLSALFSLIYFLLFYSPKTNIRKYNETTNGTVSKIESRSGFSNSFQGTRYVTLYYVVYFDYKVNSIHYSNEMIVSQRSGDAEFIRFLENKKPNEPVLVRYNESNPAESVIDKNAYTQ